MNITVRQRTASQRLTIVDCDIHPAFGSPAELNPFLPARWREHITTFGEHVRHGLTGQLPYPRMMAAGMRMDSFPERGPPGSDLSLMRAQHLDANGVEVGMLMPLSRAGMEERNLDFAAALSRAVNDWQLEHWVPREPRLRAGIVVSQEDAAGAVRGNERRGSGPPIVLIFMAPRSRDAPRHPADWATVPVAEPSP